MVPTLFDKGLADIHVHGAGGIFHLYFSDEALRHRRNDKGHIFLPAAAFTKNEIRQVAFQKRQALPAVDRAAASLAMTRLFLQHITLPPVGAVISGYAPVNNEIDPIPLMTALRARGYRCAVPAPQEREQRLAFLEWTPQTPMRTGLYNIPEPDPRHAEELVPHLLIVPLVAFDAAGHRMGYGSGYFDRTFAFLKQIQKFYAVGVAFDAQKYDAVPVDAYDYTLDEVVTETAVYQAGKNRI